MSYLLSQDFKTLNDFGVTSASQVISAKLYYFRDLPRRGYYLYVVPEEIEYIQGYNFRTFDAFAGVTTFVKSVARRSKKSDAEAIAEAEKQIMQIVKQVAEKNHLRLAEEEDKQ